MAWESFTIDGYEVTAVTVNTDGLPGVYGYIRLFWEGQQRATLWFYRDTVSIAPNNHSALVALKVLRALFASAICGLCRPAEKREAGNLWLERSYEGRLAGHWSGAGRRR